MVVKFRYGRFGSGKTSATVYDLIKDLVNDGRIPISNMKQLRLPKAVHITPMDIIMSLKPSSREEEAVIEYAIKKLSNKKTSLNDTQLKAIMNSKEPKNLFLDEIGKWWDSRNSSSQLNRFFAYFVDQTRKRNMNLYCTDQHSGGFDLRGRQVTDHLIKCVGQYYPVNLIRDDLGRPVPYMFHYWDMDLEFDKVRYYTIPASLMQYIYPFYNSLEIISPAELIIAEHNQRIGETT